MPFFIFHRKFFPISKLRSNNRKWTSNDYSWCITNTIHEKLLTEMDPKSFYLIPIQKLNCERKNVKPETRNGWELTQESNWQFISELKVFGFSQISYVCACATSMHFKSAKSKMKKKVLKHHMHTKMRIRTKKKCFYATDDIELYALYV